MVWEMGVKKPGIKSMAGWTEAVRHLESGGRRCHYSSVEDIRYTGAVHVSEYEYAHRRPMREGLGRMKARVRAHGTASMAMVRVLSSPWTSAQAAISYHGRRTTCPSLASRQVIDIKYSHNSFHTVRLRRRPVKAFS